MNFSRYRALIFDFDNTLIASEQYHVQAFAMAVKQLLGKELSWNEGLEFLGLTSREMGQRMLERMNRHDVTADEIVALKRKLVPEIFTLTYYPGVQDFLHLAYERGCWKLGIASNSPRFFIEDCLNKGNVRQCFSHLVTSDDVKATKPAPDIFLKAIEKLEISPKEALVFEDSTVGLTAAKSAGLDSIWVLNPGNPIPECIEDGQPMGTWKNFMKWL